jgi:CheY-like chemotaxis protein
MKTDPPIFLQGYQQLMPFHVQEILLVSSLYDAFILQEDGRLDELILGEFLDLNLRSMPKLTHVATGEEALRLARERGRFHLILTTLNLADMNARQLAERVREAGLDTPVLVLAYDNREANDFLARNPDAPIDRVFLWQGNARILLAIVKYVEDKRNVAHDTLAAGVRVIIVVEDNIRYYSSFLPMIYTELIEQSQRLLGEGLNLSHKLVRIRTRPKILLCSTYEDACEQFETYREWVLGVISDIEFPKDGLLCRSAGFELARRVRRDVPDLPLVLHSSQSQYEAPARAEGASFLLKGSPTLLSDLRRFMIDQFAFGDFVFRLPDGTEVGRASDLKELEERLRTIPAQSVAFHGERNHFSNWFMARTEFALARKLRPRKVTDYSGPEAIRDDLIASIAEYRREQAEVLVGDFDAGGFDPETDTFTRIGRGSLGGKARGLAFVRHLLHGHRADDPDAGLRVMVPPAVVLATDVFDRFLDDAGLLDFAVQCGDDEEILRAFLVAPFPEDALTDLEAFLEAVRYPLAVRSSSLLEDSQYQPFTGVYDTYMLPNAHADTGVRLRQLEVAIKKIYASTFSHRTKAYLKATPYRLEEEKMAVIVQRLVGRTHGNRFYPDFAGVARSHNFYPTPPMTSADGVVAVGLGLGRTVVEGGKCVSFCPRYPRHIVQFSSVKDIITNSQREFWAVEIDPGDARTDPGVLLSETSFGLEVAEEDGTLGAVGSTYSHENTAVYDGLSRKGVRLVSFAPVLKHGAFPLAETLDRLLEIGAKGMGRAVEIEFAVRLGTATDRGAELGFLQIRPLVLSRETEELEIEEVEPEALLCRSSRVLGHGQVDSIRDIVVVDFYRFDRARSREAAAEVGRLNAVLQEERRPFALIGVGRWGSTDPWLGIPVGWDQISGARVIVEAGFRDLRITPSQGSHFFQNLTAFEVGYFTVNPEAGEGFVDWDWLAGHPALHDHASVRHLRLDEPIVARMNGKTNQGAIYKPRPRPS